jgi:predicted ATPase
MMLEFVRIQRFKTLYDASFPLSNLNIFSGLNGMGKSSFIQVLLLLRQSFEKGLFPAKGLFLHGDYVSLGTGSDVLSESSDKDELEFILTWSDRQPDRYRFRYSADSDVQPLLDSSVSNEHFSVNVSEHKSPYSLFNTKFQYLSADRMSPQTMYGKSDYHVVTMNSLGNHGEYTPHYIAEHGLRKISIPFLKHDKTEGLSFIENLNAWMAEISPGIRVEVKLQNETNSVALQYCFAQHNDITASFKPQNVGFGITFVLPLVVALLKAKPGDLLLLENPEAHLHPAGQSLLGKLCALASHHGVQLCIETHSDHFLNGMRVAVKENQIEPQEVKLFFLERQDCSAHYSTVISPSIDKDGRLDYWPKGFFDETNTVLEKLLCPPG